MHNKPTFTKIIGFDEAKQLLEQVRRDRGFSSGYQEWDRLSGGLVRSGVTLLAARPAMGKTSFVLNVVNRLSMQLNGTILIFSPNLSSGEIAMRLISIETGVTARELFNGSRAADELLEKCADFIQFQKSAIEMETLTAPSIENICSRSYRIPKLRLLVVNNIERISKPFGELTPGVSWDKNCEPKDKVLDSLKMLAKELRVPVLCTANLHRSLERRKNKRPCLRDLKKVGIPAESVDQIAFLYRDRYYEPEGEEGAELIVAKVAQGDVGTICLNCDAATKRFTEM